ncbi:MAG: Nramp family divalent metal transporter [Rhodothermales bacterium]
MSSVLQTKVPKKLSQYGPALFMIGATIGTGSVSSLVVAGAEHGTSLLWALIPSCLFYWALVSAMSRLTIASGQTFVAAVTTHIGRPAGLYLVFAIVIGQFSSNIGVLGIVAEAFASWINGSFLLSAIFWSSVIYLLIFFGKYSLFEKTLTVLVAILGLSFVFNLVMVKPSVSTIAQGLVPSIPEGGAVVVAAMVGTTLAGSIIMMRSFVVADKGWSLKDLAHERRDATLSAVLIFVLSGIIMACAAATLHAQGIHVDKAIDMAYTLEPIAGSFAATLFVVGIVAAGLSSAFPNALVSIWTISDYFKLERNPALPHFRIIAFIYCSAGLIAPLAGGKPVSIQIASLAIQAIFMPLLILFMMILLNNKKLVGEHTNAKTMNFICAIAFLFTSYMAFQAVKGLLSML